MAVKTKTQAPAFSTIDTSSLGNYQIPEYPQRIWKTVYYTIRELQGLAAKRAIESEGDEFNWADFKVKFIVTFGTPEERKYTLEQLLDYAHRVFAKNLEELIELNRRSWERRRGWQQSQQAEADSYEYSEFSSDDEDYSDYEYESEAG